MLLSNLYTTKNKKLRITDMSHGEHHASAHENHHELPEPDRIPIDDPGQDFVVMRKEGSKWITTHQGPNGDFYTIANDDTPEANMTLYNEDKRNTKLKDALANDLYRLNSMGAPIRPAKSSEDFVNNLEEAGTNSEFGSYDVGKTGSFISYGTGESGSNEMAAISERSASIVLSNEARDKALEEGQSVQEAQEIGAQMYREQEGYKVTSRVSPGINVQPEAFPLSKQVTSKQEQDKPVIDTKERFRTAKWMFKTGRRAVIGFKVIKSAGIKTTASYYASKASDAIENTANYSVSKVAEIIETTAEHSVEAIKNVSLREAEALLRDVDTAVKQAVEEFKSAQQTLQDVPRKVSYEYKVAIRELGNDMLKVGNMWLAYREKIKKEVEGRAKAIRHYANPSSPTPST